ncbi:MAG: heme o synthase [Chloroflexaceae bacterium]|jgi:protoheme IX farnesyltransferase|nr:heme o synthase [Chloroflexaceae bacterium]
MKTPSYRLVLLGSACSAFFLSLAGGSLHASGQSLAALPGDMWMQLFHGPVLVGSALLMLLAALLAWRQPGADRLSRWPSLAAPFVLLAYALVVLLLPQFGGGSLSSAIDLALATLLLACPVAASVALLVPAAGREQRVGGRAAAWMKSYRRVGLAAVSMVWLLLLIGSSMVLLGSSNTTLQLLHRVAAMAAALLLATLFWLTWRVRRNDQLMLGLTATALALLSAEALVGAASLAIDLPGVLRWLHLVLGVELWAAVVIVGALVWRRPAPELADLPLPTVKSDNATPSLLKDYISLTKPGVLSLLLVTTLAAMYITDRGAPSLWLVFWTMLGGYLAAGGASALNCAFDNDIDINMGRTSRRPVPSGRIPAQHAFWFGLSLCVLSFVVLSVFTTLLAAVLAMVGVVYYALIYTRWLKRSTWHNIIIGGGAGAIPPLVGWTAVTGELSLAAVLLFVIIFYWTPPHFWALALVRQKDYARAGVPMLPVVAGENETRWQILLYSLLMVAVSLLLTPLQAMGGIYLLLALVLGIIFLRYAWYVWRDGGQTYVWGLYKYSLLYLALLFVAMVLDRAVLG